MAALLAATLLTGCAEDSFSTKETDRRTLTLDVVETDWNGETIAVSRSGDTMDGLKSSYARSWDFTSLADKAALLSLSGLTFSPTGGLDANLAVEAVDGAKAVKLNGSLTISDLRATQTLTIVYKTTDAVARTLVPIPRNFATDSGFDATTEKTTGIASVTADGDGTINTTGPVYIYSISLSAAENEGFGLYCQELSYRNTPVKWNSSKGVWIIGGNDYNEYWPINSPGTLNIYAYAPYKSDGYTITDADAENNTGDTLLTFVAEKHSVPGHTGELSGSNVDLLYAYNQHNRNSDTPAELEFNHALAKLTFGTITNNTGETIYLNGFTVTGTLHEEGDLNLSTGVWTPDAGSVSTIQYPPPYIQIVNSEEDLAGAPATGYIAKTYIPPLPDKQTITPPMPSRELLVIPNSNGKINLTIQVNSSKDTEEFSFDVELEQGKNKTYNITVEKNYEVVIE